MKSDNTDNTDNADPVHRASRIAAGDRTEAILRWIEQGFAAYVRAGGEVRLETCLRLPTTPTGMRRLQRDYWLNKAADELEATSAWSLARELKEQLDIYLTRGGWSASRESDSPPPGTSKLRTALFFAMKAVDGADLSAKRLEQIVGSRLAKKVL